MPAEHLTAEQKDTKETIIEHLKNDVQEVDRDVLKIWKNNKTEFVVPSFSSKFEEKENITDEVSHLYAETINLQKVWNEKRRIIKILKRQIGYEGNNLMKCFDTAANGGENLKQFNEIQEAFYRCQYYKQLLSEIDNYMKKCDEIEQEWPKIKLQKIRQELEMSKISKTKTSEELEENLINDSPKAIESIFNQKIEKELNAEQKQMERNEIFDCHRQILDWNIATSLNKCNFGGIIDSKYIDRLNNYCLLNFYKKSGTIDDNEFNEKSKGAVIKPAADYRLGDIITDMNITVGIETETIIDNPDTNKNKLGKTNVINKKIDSSKSKFASRKFNKLFENYEKRKKMRNYFNKLAESPILQKPKRSVTIFPYKKKTEDDVSTFSEFDVSCSTNEENQNVAIENIETNKEDTTSQDISSEELSEMEKIQNKIFDEYMKKSKIKLIADNRKRFSIDWTVPMDEIDWCQLPVATPSELSNSTGCMNLIETNSELSNDANLEARTPENIQN